MMMFGMMGPWMWLFYLVLLGLLVFGVVWFVRQMPAMQQTPSPQDTRHQEMNDPREVLRLRYVRGELSREEYLSMLKDLDEAA